MANQKSRHAARRQRLSIAFSFAGLLVGLSLCPPPASATPQFARQQQARCTACHTIPPQLNSHGLAFQASGYRASPVSAESSRDDSASIPLAAWITARFEDPGGDAASDLFLPKVELISGGRIGEWWSYFVEWRVVSLSLQADGSLNDRGGRFEDLFVERDFGDRHALKLGQYRSVNQVDVSLRLSPSEPVLFRHGLETGDHDDPRVASLSRFSPSSRSPSVGYAFQSVRGGQPSDGLFHHVTVPFIGEFSIPLSDEASERASFELAEPKGVFLETFYRRERKSVGAHAFLEDDAWLLTVLGTYDWRGLFLTAGVGVDDPGSGETRERVSIEFEYLVEPRGDLRAATGLRLEDVSDDGRRVGWIPYLAVAAPNARYTLLLQLEYRSVEGADSFVVDLSALF